jgi:flavin reductase (DIM6/NTAB) family NADH-FMN oxidoreductase RutF
MQDGWKKALGQMTYGIYVLTSRHEDAVNGMIASWVSQVSYEPLLIMAAVHPNRYSHRLIEQSGSFTLHVIDRRRKDFLSHFKGPDPKAKLASVQWKHGLTGCPVLQDCLAYLECRVKTAHSPGNHTLYIGEVVAAESLNTGMPFSSMDYDGIYLGRK